MNSMSRVFCSYAHSDGAFFDELTVHLAALKRSGCIEMWSDRDIPAGGEWEKHISNALEGADVVLMLVSPDFINSDYCFEVEMQRALELADSGQLIALPILIRACDWKSMPFARLQMMPRDRHPITPIGSRLPHERDEAWAHVAHIIRGLLGRHVRSRPPTSVAATNYGELLIRFLRAWSTWGFNPARIRNWGARQSGYEALGEMTVEQIRIELENLACVGTVKRFKASTGAFLYRAAS